MTAETQALVLPGSTLTTQNSKWLAVTEGFAGKVVVLPETIDQWIWLNPLQKNSEIAHSLAASLKSLAEGRPVQIQKQGATWIILGYILGGFILLNILSLVLGLLFNM